MNDNSDNGDTLPAAIVKSKAGEKLAEAVKNVVDYTAGPQRILNVEKARAEAALIKTKADLEINELRAEAAARLLDKEVRNQRNIHAITHEAFKALPPPDTSVSDQPVSEDFIYRFFEECDGVGNAEMQQIWGKLLAGEVVRPGTFHPRTLRIVRDMLPSDAKLFGTLCRFGLPFGDLRVLIFFGSEDKIYRSLGLDFDALRHLEALGLLQLGGYAGLVADDLPSKLSLRYGHETLELEIKTSEISLGGALLTEAGQELWTLCTLTPVPGFLKYIAAQWRAQGQEVNIIAATD